MVRRRRPAVNHGRSAFAELAALDQAGLCLGQYKNACREETMRRPSIATIGVAFALAFLHSSQAQTPAGVLTGLVSSAEEPTMEGVLVSATRADSNVTITVVTDADGHYGFPASRL